jgi:hypothetical protein
MQTTVPHMTTCNNWHKDGNVSHVSCRTGSSSVPIRVTGLTSLLSPLLQIMPSISLYFLSILKAFYQIPIMVLWPMTNNTVFTFLIHQCICTGMKYMARSIRFSDTKCAKMQQQIFGILKKILGWHPQNPVEGEKGKAKDSRGKGSRELDGSY